ncbi:hypothetical protein D3C73_1509980 [compost metagenome]
MQPQLPGQRVAIHSRQADIQHHQRTGRLLLQRQCIVGVGSLKHRRTPTPQLGCNDLSVQCVVLDQQDAHAVQPGQRGRC